MASKNNIFEDLARVSGSVATIAFESAKNIQDKVKAHSPVSGKSHEQVTREEFEVFKSLVSKIKVENEVILKDLSELKKQLQTVASSMDILKEQFGKAKPAGELTSDLNGELKNIGEQIDRKLGDFELKLNLQQDKIDELSTRVADKSAKTVKKAVDNISLFGDE